MLVHLAISDFAIIRRLEISFKPGLNILTGETGAGKSIIINAVHLILGGRASSDLIRTGAEEAHVEALFSIPEQSDVRTCLKELGLPDQNELLIARTISREGRNKIQLNGSLATLQMAVRIGSLLISIAGQHEHQYLLRPENHLYMLDDFGGLTAERYALNGLYDQFDEQKARMRRLEKEIRTAREKQELARFQINEIESAQLEEKEDTRLEEERRRLQYARDLLALISETYQSLYEKEDAVISGLSHYLKGIERGMSMDSSLEGVAQSLRTAKLEIEEAAMKLRDLQHEILIDPARLEQVEERLQQLGGLKRKYGPTLDDVISFKDRLSVGMEDLEHKERELHTLGMKLDSLREEVHKKARALSRERHQTADKLAGALEAELDLLDMKGTRLEVLFHDQNRPGVENPSDLPGSMTADGFDRVELAISPNVGEELRPLARIASGGELSRIMLAMKTILARKASVESLIFDEIDAGIGGATSEIVGEKLWDLARYHQIICITHLAPIASKGNSHFQVKKTVHEGRTQTRMVELNEDGRLKEIARLLAGKVISDQALAHAREMLREKNH